ncbi:MAG: putative MAPEG superfamily protein [Oleispira sp.]|jgi:uncharacterized MAPEG superfamily protein
MTPTIATTMTTAYWCVLIAILMPVLFTGLAKFTGGFRPKDNHAPRAYLDQLSGWRQRSNWAQQNTFESIPGFMAAVIIAHQMAGNQDNIDMLAVSYIIIRVVYGILYIADIALMRSVAWFLGVACILGLFFT